LYKELDAARGRESGRQLSENREEQDGATRIAALKHGCICRILVSISVSSYTELSNFPLSSRAPPILPHRESGDENVSWRRYVATYKKKISYAATA